MEVLMRHLARRVRPQALAIAIVLSVAACPNRKVAVLPPTSTGTDTKDIDISQQVDLLFVIDNSASTADKQQLFAQNFPNFVTALDSFQMGRPDLHLAVVDSTVDIGVDTYDLGNGQGCPSPDPNDNGLMQNVARVMGCSPPSGQFIIDSPNGSGGRNVNYTGQLQDAFACIAQVGATGCGFEAQLEAMKRALDGTQGSNAGFLRPGAYLGIVILTDEDDASVSDPSVFGPPKLPSDFAVQPQYAYNCNAPIDPVNPATYSGCTVRTGSYLQDPAYYASFLTSIKPAAQIVAAAIAGPPPGLLTDDVPPQQCTTCGSTNNEISTGQLQIPGQAQPQMMALEPACSTMIGSDMALARPAIRIASFLDDLAAAGAQRGFYTACQSDYQDALAGIGAILAAAVSPCLSAQVDQTDTEPNNPGLQLQCTVSDVIDQGTSAEQQTLIPTCEMSESPNLSVTPACTTGPCPAASATTPCWWIQSNPTTCPAPSSGLAVYVDRIMPPVAGTVVDVQCAINSQ
jgi:hypothetical protein